MAAFQDENKMSKTSIDKGEYVCVSAFKLFCFPIKSFKSTESCVVLETETPFFLFWERACTSRIKHWRSENVYVNAYPHPTLWVLCAQALKTEHQGKCFYLLFKMSNSKQLGVRNHSAPVILNITERESLLEERESCRREAEQASMCLRKRVTEHDRGCGKGVG